MIEFRNVSKSFWTGTQRKVILDQASFRIDLGVSMGILAPNGAGKTTLINMMSGLEKPDEGEIIRTSKISFPLGYMGGLNGKMDAVTNARYIARIYALDPIMSKLFAGIFVVWANISKCRSPHTPRGCVRVLHWHYCWLSNSIST